MMPQRITLQDILLDECIVSLGGKLAATIDPCRRAVRQALEWLRERPGQEEGIHPDHLTRIVVETYLAYMERQGRVSKRQ
jgi:hypothetical protein